MPRSDGTKVRRAKKRRVPQGLVAVQAKRKSIAGVMKERQAAMEGYVPGAVVFFCEEWVANTNGAHELSYDVWDLIMFEPRWVMRKPMTSCLTFRHRLLGVWTKSM